MKTGAWLAFRLCALLLPLLVADRTLAHDARPLSLTLFEQSAGLYRVVLRIPPTLSPGDAPVLQWPADCETLEAAPLPLGAGSASLVRCPAGLGGETLELRYPAFNPSLTSLIRLQTLDGGSLTAVLPPDRLSWTVPESPDSATIAWQYTKLGFRHILAGVDHLLFVAGLLLLARGRGRLVLAISGFTLAHSLTLALATFGLVRLPVALVETLIALSVVFLAAEVLRNDERGFSQRYPVLLSFAFGLLHGFGFAGALGEIALPRGEILRALLFFNVGVELGQLAFIALCALLWRPYARWHSRVLAADADWRSPPLLRAASWLIGLPAAYWCVERSLLLFGV